MPERRSSQSLNWSLRQTTRAPKSASQSRPAVTRRADEEERGSIATKSVRKDQQRLLRTELRPNRHRTDASANWSSYAVFGAKTCTIDDIGLIQTHWAELGGHRNWSWSTVVAKVRHETRLRMQGKVLFTGTIAMSWVNAFPRLAALNPGKSSPRG